MLIQSEAGIAACNEVVGKHTEVPRLIVIHRPIAIGNLWRGKQNCILIYVQYFVSIFYTIASTDQADFIVRASIVWHDSLCATNSVHISNVEHVEVPDVAMVLVVEK